MPLNRLIGLATRLAESHPYPWKLAWELVHRLPFLLPHDRSYFALRHFIKAAPNGLFLDVGANDGISVLSFRKFDRNYQIFSLEPNLMLEPSLRGIRLKDARFDYKMVGAGAASSRVRFFVPTYRGIILHTFTSSKREQVQEALAASFGDSVAKLAKIEVVENEVIPLDDLNLDPTIIKIDAEGFDYQILLGLDATLARSRPFLVIELAWTERDDIAQYLGARNYCLLAYDNTSDQFSKDVETYRSHKPGQRNFFAAPNEKLHVLPIGALH
jgi:FkbM family methyltransferase